MVGPASNENETRLITVCGALVFFCICFTFTAM